MIRAGFDDAAKAGSDIADSLAMRTNVSTSEGSNSVRRRVGFFFEFHHGLFQRYSPGRRLIAQRVGMGISSEWTGKMTRYDGFTLRPGRVVW